MFLFYRKDFFTLLGELKVVNNYLFIYLFIIYLFIYLFIYYYLELLVLATGENIAPVPIESALKEQLPIVSNAVIVGDQKSYISCLITLKVLIIPLDTPLNTDNIL